MTDPERRLIIEGTTHLAEGQNFYDQAPFEGAINAAAETTLFSRDQYRRGISYVVKSLYLPESSAPRAHRRDSAFLTTQIGGLAKTSPMFKEAAAEASPEEFRNMKAEFARYLLGTVDTLNHYPLWDQYVHTQRRNSGYGENGEIGPRTRPNVALEVPTYAAWLVDQQARQRRGRMWGIQDVTDVVPPQEAARIAQGRRYEGRRWVIRKYMQ